MRGRRFEAERQQRRWLKSLGPRSSKASLILIGVVVGLIASLYYAWIAAPVVYTEASPARLSDRFKDEYVLLVSQSYVVDDNWERTNARLAALGESDIEGRITAQLERFLREGNPAVELRYLAALAARLGSESPGVAMFAPPATPGAVSTATGRDSSNDGPGLENGPGSQNDLSLGDGQDPGSGDQLTGFSTATPAPTWTRTPAATPIPTIRPSPTAVPVFRLLRREMICQSDEPINRIEVIAVDPFLEELPGAEVVVEWDQGEDHFFTGYQPNKGPGYGDFTMRPGVTYRLFMAAGSPIIEDLSFADCPEDEGGLSAGWRLTFQNTDVVQETPTPLGN